MTLTCFDCKSDLRQTGQNKNRKTGAVVHYLACPQCRSRFKLQVATGILERSTTGQMCRCRLRMTTRVHSQGRKVYECFCGRTYHITKSGQTWWEEPDITPLYVRKPDIPLTHPEHFEVMAEYERQYTKFKHRHKLWQKGLRDG